METKIFYLILAIVVLDFLFERLLDYLNSKHWSDKIPDSLKSVLNKEAYQKSQAYKKTNYKFGILTSSFSFLLIMIMLLIEGFAWVNNLSLGFSNNVIVSALIFFAILGLGADILTTPFSVYDTFVIEERFGFNKTKPKTFILDKLKSWLLTAILGGGILSFIIFIWTKTENIFWVLAWGAVTLISLFMTMFYSSLIVPLFNKQTPLEDGELKTAIEAFAMKAGFGLKNIFVIDGSKRSSKANAYFTGFGPRKRVVLYDTLIQDLSSNEIVAVLAHEIGHYKKRHMIWGLLGGILQTGIMLYLFSIFISNPALSGALGVDKPNFHIGMVAFGILYTPLSFLTGIATNILSRKNEYEADAYAAGFGLGNDLAAGLKKLSVKNLSNLTPHPLYVFFNYSHPTLIQRLKRLETSK
ncbi:MAG: M48 family metallopeptidase [Prolixibacteraceae bacterium]|nr:M48 family metallopeptidase [Prolixibacteraceae bacterium]